jgi:hypothetical protein
MACALPYQERSFGAVVSTFAFHHLTLDQMDRTLSEIRRVLRPGGRPVVADFAAPHNVLMALSAWILTRDSCVSAETDLVGARSHWSIWPARLFAFCDPFCKVLMQLSRALGDDLRRCAADSVVCNLCTILALATGFIGAARSRWPSATGDGGNAT